MAPVPRLTLDHRGDRHQVRPHADRRRYRFRIICSVKVKPLKPPTRTRVPVIAVEESIESVSDWDCH
jgi:hypothetical protein